MTISKDKDLLSCIITSPHGIRGLVKVKCFFSDFSSIDKYKMHDMDGNFYCCLFKFFIKNNRCVMYVNDINNCDEAEKLRGKKLYIKRSSLPNLEQDDFYYYDMVDLLLKQVDGSLYGCIINVLNFGAGEVAEIVLHNSNDKVYLPINDSIFKNVDYDNGCATVFLPEYLE